MTVWISTVLGVLFLALAIASTVLMFQFWGYPYDKDRKKSECPQWKMNIHRGVGYAFAIVYVIMMIKMVPRLWTYQIEFPARTVAHIMLGMTIGVILVLKISILRWFRHFEEWMPALGVLLLVCTVLLTGLSIPNVLRERALAAGGPGGSAFSDKNRERIEKLLADADLPEATNVAALVSSDSLRAGRSVLLEECVYCHDLKTAIARSRSPKEWYRTVLRMQQKPTIGVSIDDDEALRVTAYLVAISPDIQRSQKAKYQDEMEKKSAMADVAKLEEMAPVVDLVAAKAVFEEECSTCHPLSDVTDAPPKNLAEVDEMIARMIDNGLDVEAATLAQIHAYMAATFAPSEKPTPTATPNPTPTPDEPPDDE